MARFQRGTTFLDRYVLLGPIGHGGVSVVYEALDTLVDRHVAIKMLDPTLASDTRAQARIRREAIITDRMRHPSVPRVYEYGDAPQTDGTRVAYVVMELLEGAVNRREIRRICSACNQQGLPDASSNRRISRGIPAPPRG